MNAAPDLTQIDTAGPTAEQVKAAREAAPVNWWTCRYCGHGAVLIGSSVDEEAKQALSHESRCRNARSDA